MMHIVQMTKDEKIAMYMKLSKRELAELLTNSNDALERALENKNNFPFIDCKEGQLPAFTPMDIPLEGSGNAPYIHPVTTCASEIYNFKDCKW